MALGGFQLNAPAAIDSGVSAPAGGVAFGTAFDIGANTSPQAIKLDARFTITGGATDGVDCEIGVQWSDDAATWPSDSEYTVIRGFVDATGGVVITSNFITLPEPKQQYGRLVFKNNNAADAILFDSEIAVQLLQSA